MASSNPYYWIEKNSISISLIIENLSFFFWFARSVQGEIEGSRVFTVFQTEERDVRSVRLPSTFS